MASTTGIETWAVDLAEVGAIYPFQGAEVLLVAAGFVAWIAWHIVQLVGEKRENAEKARRYGDHETVKQVVDEHGD